MKDCPATDRYLSVRDAAKELGTTPAIADQFLTESAGVFVNSTEAKLRDTNFEKCAKKWGIELDKAAAYNEKMGGDYSKFRRMISNKGLVLQSMLQDDLMETLLDPERLKAISPVEKAKMLDAIARASQNTSQGMTSVTVNVGNAPNAIKTVRDVRELLERPDKNGS